MAPRTASIPDDETAFRTILAGVPLIYVALPDPEAESAGDIRVIDESGEDYLFSAQQFVAVEVPSAVQVSVRRAPRSAAR